MLFKPTHAAKTWDAWVCHHAGTYHLFYLTSERYPGDGFGAATSADGVHWTDHGRVLGPSDRMVRYLGSGSVWKDARFGENRRFIGNYSEWRADGTHNVQAIYFAWSHDLLHWAKFGDEFAFGIDERYYQRVVENARGPWEDPRWDCIDAIPRPDGGYYGYWTATPKDFLGFGFGASDDGLHWQALAPPRIEWGADGQPRMIFVEVGGVRQVEGRYYAMLGDYASTNCGMFGFVADSPAGPFRPAARNFELLRNRSRMHAYFTRFVDSPDGVLVCHHSLARGQFSDEQFTVYYAPFKQARVIDGDLYLAWWPGNDMLKVQESPMDEPAGPVHFDPDTVAVLEGHMMLPARLAVDHQDGTSTLIQVDEQGVTQIGPAGVGGADFAYEERIDRRMRLTEPPSFRLLVHHTMLEFYLDDILVQCYTMVKDPSGTLRCTNAHDLRLWHWA